MTTAITTTRPPALPDDDILMPELTSTDGLPVFVNPFAVQIVLGRQNKVVQVHWIKGSGSATTNVTGDAKEIRAKICEAVRAYGEHMLRVEMDGCSLEKLIGLISEKLIATWRGQVAELVQTELLRMTGAEPETEPEASRPSKRKT